MMPLANVQDETVQVRHPGTPAGQVSGIQLGHLVDEDGRTTSLFATWTVFLTLNQMPLSRRTLSRNCRSSMQSSQV